MRTEILPWHDAGPDEREETIRRAAELIASGELVAYPTETVYGLAAAGMDGAAVDRVFEAKGRPASRPLLLAVEDLDVATDLVVEIPRDARRLAARYWPGPLSMVMVAAPGVPMGVTAGTGSVGLRCPAHPAARALVRAAGPITSPSANISGRPSPTTGEEVVADLDGRIAAVIDGGPTAGATPSTVVDLREGISILREGAVPASEILEFLAEPELDSGDRGSVLFVCTGNTCRSPVAEAVFRDALAARGLLAESAGVAALKGMKASDGSSRAAREAGYDLSGHRSRGLEDVCWSKVALVVTMTREHARAVRDHLEDSGRENDAPVLSLGDLAGGGDIADPLGGPLEEYTQMLRDMEDRVELVAEAISRELSKGGGS